LYYNPSSKVNFHSADLIIIRFCVISQGYVGSEEIIYIINVQIYDTGRCSLLKSRPNTEDNRTNMINCLRMVSEWHLRNPRHVAVRQQAKTDQRFFHSFTRLRSHLTQETQLSSALTSTKSHSACNYRKQQT